MPENSAVYTSNKGRGAALLKEKKGEDWSRQWPRLRLEENVKTVFRQSSQEQPNSVEERTNVTEEAPGKRVTVIVGAKGGGDALPPNGMARARSES